MIYYWQKTDKFKTTGYRVAITISNHDCVSLHKFRQFYCLPCPLRLLYLYLGHLLLCFLWLVSHVFLGLLWLISHTPVGLFWLVPHLLFESSQILSVLLSVLSTTSAVHMSGLFTFASLIAYLSCSSRLWLAQSAFFIHCLLFLPRLSAPLTSSMIVLLHTYAFTFFYWFIY